MNDNITEEVITKPKQQKHFNHRIQKADAALQRSRLELDDVRSRPQAFTSYVGVNPLVTAAAPLLSLASKLLQSQRHKNVNDLYQHLAEEIKAFEIHAQQLNCRSETVLVARFAICALIDEVILNNAWGNETVWGRYKMLPLFQQENQADERFYIILDRLSSEPELYIDILELMYLCLSLGFWGKYRHTEHGVEQRSLLIDSLYQTIRLQRGEFEKALAKEQDHRNTEKKLKKYFNPWRTLIITSVLMLSLYFGFNYLIELSTSPMQQNLQTIISNRNT